MVELPQSQTDYEEAGHGAGVVRLFPIENGRDTDLEEKLTMCLTLRCSTQHIGKCETHRVARDSKNSTVG